MAKERKKKNPAFSSREAGFSLVTLGMTFGPKGQALIHDDARIAALDNEEAKLYGELAAVHVDLKHCEHLCDRMLDLRRTLKKFPRDADGAGFAFDNMRMAMISALVSYMRCFGQGKRERLDPRVIWKEGDSARDAHQYFKDVRDKFVAHSVNDFEDVSVGLTYMFEDKERTVLSLTDVIGTAALPNEYLLKWLRRLSKQAQKHVENRLDQIRAPLLKRAKALTKAELDALPTLQIKAGSYDSPTRPKRKTR